MNRIMLDYDFMRRPEGNVEFICSLHKEQVFTEICQGG